MKIYQHDLRGFQLSGHSTGGIHTSIAVENIPLIFDIGSGGRETAIHIPTLLLSHGHLDHSAAIPYYIAQRSLRNLPPPTLYVPASIHEPLTKILDLWSEIEDFKIPYTMIAAEPGLRYPLNNRLQIEPFATSHRIDSLGYTVIESQKKLRDEFRHLPGPEIVKLRHEPGSDERLFDEKMLPYISYSGDTLIDAILENDFVLESKILILECTYLSEDRSIKRARQWGHIHLAEIGAHSDAFAQVEHLLLIHHSDRYSAEDVAAAYDHYLPEDLRRRTTALNYPSAARTAADKSIRPS